MILTGPAINLAHKAGDIVIEPFSESCINPNSYNFQLFPHLIMLTGNTGERRRTEISLSRCGHLLQPGNLYLGATLQFFGSSKYVMTLLGRSSLGRLGLFLNITADLGHAGSASRWTLELAVVQPLRVYPGMCIGQVAFWMQKGKSGEYGGRYKGDLLPFPNKDFGLLRCE
jgi:dCTP deaminase